MNTIISIIKLIINVIFFLIYSLFGILFGGVAYGFYMSYILDKTVPDESDPIHLKIALISIVVVFILTILMRKFLYLNISSKNKEKNSQEEHFSYTTMKSEKKNNRENREQWREKDNLEIYVNKEI